jgi:protein-S-isoprenylcysteine O-methyltransferase Ste14
MTELLDALRISGKGNRRAAAISIWTSFAAAMVLIAAAQAAVENALRFSASQIVALFVTVWIGWSVWHSFLFEWSRLRLLRSDAACAYRKAFLCHIFPGITVGFSQMLRPAWNGDNLSSNSVFPRWPTSAGSFVSLSLGSLVFILAFALFASAWQTLGAARVGFAAEFVSVDGFQPLRRGPYRLVRHPLFWSGIMISWAIALVCNRPIGYVLAVLNVLYGLAYNFLEDRRLQIVFGENYAAYAREVPHIIPIRVRNLVLGD